MACALVLKVMLMQTTLVTSVDSFNTSHYNVFSEEVLELKSLKVEGHSSKLIHQQKNITKQNLNTGMPAL